MRHGLLMDIDSTLSGCSYTKIEKPNFLDKHGKPGVAIGGHFSDLDEIRYECATTDLYIHSLEEMKNAAGQTTYWMVYSCREKSIPQNAMTLLKKLNSEGKLPKGSLSTDRLAELQGKPTTEAVLEL